MRLIRATVLADLLGLDLSHFLCFTCQIRSREAVLCSRVSLVTELVKENHGTCWCSVFYCRVSSQVCERFLPKMVTTCWLCVQLKLYQEQSATDENMSSRRVAVEHATWSCVGLPLIYNFLGDGMWNIRFVGCRTAIDSRKVHSMSELCNQQNCALELGVNLLNEKCALELFGKWTVVLYFSGHESQSMVTSAATKIVGLASHVSDRFDGRFQSALFAQMRRLHFEASIMIVAHLRSQVSQESSQAGIRKLPVAEKIARLERQKARLSGVSVTGELQPSHALIDLVASMCDTNSVIRVAPSKCSKREKEVQQLTKEKAPVVMVEQHMPKFSGSDMEVGADTSTELHWQWAMQRRGVAFDHCGLIRWDTHQKRLQQLLGLVSREPPDGYLGAVGAAGEGRSGTVHHHGRGAATDDNQFRRPWMRL